MKKIIKWGLIGFIGLMIIGAIAGGDDKKSTNNQQSGSGSEKQETTQEKEDQAQPAIKMSTASFIKEFDENQLAAEEKYKGKLVEFTAFISNISEGLMGEVYLVLKPTAEEYYFGTNVQCYFEDKSELLSLKNEQSVTLQGTVDTQTLGIIAIKDCKILSAG